MIETTGADYQSSQFEKAMFAALSKEGKTCYEVAAALGQLPWQKYGGIVDKPENLHVITFDANALGGVKRFLLESCGAPAEALRFTVYNMQEDLRKVSASQQDYNRDLYTGVLMAIDKVAQKAKGVPMLLVSSLTGLAQGLERALAGPPGAKKGSGMDQSKWQEFSHQLNEIRNMAQQDNWHCLWEAHVYKPPSTGQSGEARPETLQISGKSGQAFPYNVERVYRVRRAYGQRHGGSNVEEMYLDCRPTFDFVANGRGFTEALKPREADPTVAFHKLGLKVGGWGAKAGKLKAKAG
jgi:hypothetical protein